MKRPCNQVAEEATWLINKSASYCAQLINNEMISCLPRLHFRNKKHGAYRVGLVWQHKDARPLLGTIIFGVQTIFTKVLQSW